MNSKGVGSKQDRIADMHYEDLYSKRVKIRIPNGFKKMNDNEIGNIYPNLKRRPDVIFSDSGGVVNITFHHTRKKTSDSELIYNLKQLTEIYKEDNTIDFINSRIENINSKDYIVLEFISHSQRNKVYNFMLITNFENRILMCAFTCAIPYLDTWRDMGQQIIRTITIQ